MMVAVMIVMMKVIVGNGSHVGIHCRVVTESTGMVVVMAMVVINGGHRDHSVRGGHRDHGDLRDMLQ